VGGTQSQVRHRGEGRRTRTDGRPPVLLTGSAAEGRVGGPTAIEGSSTGGDPVEDPPAHDQGSTEGGLVWDPPVLDEGSTSGGLVGDLPALEEGSADGDLVGGPPAVSAGSTEGDRVAGPPVLAEGSTDGGSCARFAPQTAVRQVRGDGRHARRRAVHVRVGLQGCRGPHQVRGGHCGEDRDSGLVKKAGRNPNAAEGQDNPMQGGRSDGGVGRSAAA